MVLWNCTVCLAYAVKWFLSFRMSHYSKRKGYHCIMLLYGNIKAKKHMMMVYYYLLIIIIITSILIIIISQSVYSILKV